VKLCNGSVLKYLKTIPWSFRPVCVFYCKEWVLCNTGIWTQKIYYAHTMMWWRTRSSADADTPARRV